MEKEDRSKLVDDLLKAATGDKYDPFALIGIKLFHKTAIEATLKHAEELLSVGDILLLPKHGIVIFTISALTKVAFELCRATAGNDTKKGFERFRKIIDQMERRELNPDELDEDLVNEVKEALKKNASQKTEAQASQHGDETVDPDPTSNLSAMQPTAGSAL